jgi:cell division protease FtsH
LNRLFQSDRPNERGTPPGGGAPGRGSRRPPTDPSNKPEGNPWRRTSRTLLFWLVLVVLAVAMYQMLDPSRVRRVPVSYSEFTSELGKGNIKSVTFSDRTVKGTFKTPYTKPASKDKRSPGGSFTDFEMTLPFPDASQLVLKLQEAGVEVNAEEREFSWTTLLLTFSPWLIFIFVWLFMIRQMQGGPKGLFSFGKSKAKLLTENKPKVTFADVAGADEAKEELREVIEFLKEPAKFQKLGGKIPKGALLLGPPGTGKTLLARAVAGEAGVPFFSMSGSDFVEMFVGVGASRVRDLFDQGKRNAPCIIFIDEIDAVGRHRGAGLGGGHDEREQTLNQLLVEMDGFESNEGVILIAATNRPDVLDPALLRPGRFDRQIVVDAPDVKGREGILKVHTRKIAIADEVNLEVLARGTPGLSGADLANLVNEAALLAARRNRDQVMMVDFEDAKDKVMMGTERRSLVITEKEKETTAYHEAGHALVARLIPGTDPVHKVTIVPRGRALGLTSYLPVDERHTYSREYLEGRMAFMLGGRVAELLVFDQLTTGAGNDLERATDLARRMVCEWGMSDKMGPLTFGRKQEEIFLGREIAQHRDYSESTAQLIDGEVKRIVIEAEEKARKLLAENLDKLKRIARALLDREILDGHELDKLINGEDLPALAASPSPATG